MVTMVPAAAGVLRAALGAILVLGAFGTPPSRWQNLSWVKTCPDAEFHEIGVLLGNATFLSYTSTYGSYYDPKYDNESMTGWARNYDYFSNPSKGGMRALFFSQDNNTQHTLGIIAFRGTDLGNAELSHSADECADRLLWNGVPYRDLPESCRESFSAYQLDYLQRALDFVAKVQAGFPGINLMLTGHSLGAGLAVLVAAIHNSKDAATTTPSAQEGEEPEGAPEGFVRAMAFASPGVKHVLEEKQIGELDPSKIVALGDLHDPVFVASLCPSDATFGSTLCTWPSNATVACDKCYESFNGTGVACRTCFEERHVYKHYYSELIPGPRPACEPRIPHPWSERCSSRGEAA